MAEEECVRLMKVRRVNGSKSRLEEQPGGRPGLAKDKDVFGKRYGGDIV
jgi:hypothetical protein